MKFLNRIFKQKSPVDKAIEKATAAMEPLLIMAIAHSLLKKEKEPKQEFPKGGISPLEEMKKADYHLTIKELEGLLIDFGNYIFSDERRNRCCERGLPDSPVTNYDLDDWVAENQN